MIGIIPVFIDVKFRCGKNFYLVDAKFSSSAQQKGCYFVESWFRIEAVRRMTELEIDILKVRLMLQTISLC